MAQAGTGAKARAYRVLHLLGKGGFGEVYLAQEEPRSPGSRQFAVRVASEALTHDAQHITRIQKVALALSWVDNRGIHPYESVTRIQGRWTIVSEYLGGVSVRELLAESYPPPLVALQIAEQVALTLAAVRRATDRKGRPLKLIHRDINPSNVLVTPKGEVRLIDFGLARKEFVAAEAASGDATFGQLAFQAPERARSADTHAIDIYALGMTLAAMLLGGTPEGQPGPLEPKGHGARARAVDQLLASANAKVGVRMLVRQALSGDPDRRPTASAFARACRQLQSAFKRAPLSGWAGPRVQGLLSGRPVMSGPLTGQLLEDTIHRPKPSPSSMSIEPTPATVTRARPSTPGIQLQREEVLSKPKVEKLQRNDGSNISSPSESSRPRTSASLVELPQDTPEHGGMALRGQGFVQPSEDVGDPSTELRRPGSSQPLPLQPTRELSPDRANSPSALGGRPYLRVDENIDDPSTVIREAPSLAPLPGGFGETNPQEQTVIQKDFGPSVLHVLETREMAPPRDDSPGIGETTVVAPTPGSGAEVEGRGFIRRWWVAGVSAAGVFAACLVVTGVVSAFFGGTSAVANMSSSLMSFNTEDSCRIHVDVGREFVQEAKVRPRREALGLLDNLQDECVAGRVGFWGTAFVIVELRNRGKDGLLRDYELHKVTEVMRQWSQ